MSLFLELHFVLVCMSFGFSIAGASLYFILLMSTRIASVIYYSSFF